MEGERQPPPPPAAAVSKVLDDDDLLAEILLRVGLPTTLVRASLVCKRWLGHASGRSFLRRFRKLHPPRLLGFYVEGDRDVPADPPAFVPVLPQPAELAAVVRRASFSLDVYRGLLAQIHDCRNGSVFVQVGTEGRAVMRVHTPLCPQRRVAFIPPLPRPALRPRGLCSFTQILSTEERGGLSYHYLYVESTVDKPETRLHIYVLQDGLWLPRAPLDMHQLPRPLLQPKPVLVDTRIYMPAGLSDIIVLDLTASSFSTIQLPRGTKHDECGGTTMLARSYDASGVYFVLVEEFQLLIWLHKGGNWSLVDTICLREMCPDSRTLGCTVEDEDSDLIIRRVGNDAEFVLLQMGRCALHLDTRRRTLRKVYEQTEEHQCFGDIHPFMMIWHPTFPALRRDHARDAM
ncbi:uncharacterized protein [Aegilops tauschii subsp. strangulata]|uniref:F-box domain-containing protein n=2 Tax=Aegilops tauschii subsp. strangulata TaxID=200361 RepID=A0A453MWJ9_AEGTS|nr:uncharacterized protein LOC109773265 [Aegilops tauschii subsp. strangulata]